MPVSKLSIVYLASPLLQVYLPSYNGFININSSANILLILFWGLETGFLPQFGWIVKVLVKKPGF